MYTKERPTSYADQYADEYDDNQEEELSEEEILATAIENIDEVYEATINSIDDGEEEGLLTYEEAQELRAKLTTNTNKS